MKDTQHIGKEVFWTFCSSFLFSESKVSGKSMENTNQIITEQPQKHIVK